jgi:NAD(P)-dependent dehydrogenase (short-subunit alcohol dehydrogenase family)
VSTTSLVIGGASEGVGGVLARKFAGRGDNVIVTSRDSSRAAAAAKEIGGVTRGLAIDLSQPETIAAALETVTEVDNVVITAMESVPVTLADFRIDDAVRSVTIKLVGYAEAVRVLRDRFRPGASVVLFGGLAKERPYPGSTMVTTFNAGLTGLVKTLAAEIAPHRVNAVHPGLIGDSPKWRDVPSHPHVAATPIGRLVTMAEVADATDFLLRNAGMNAQDLYIDGGFLIR